jgi:AraC family transcriptional regulator
LRARLERAANLLLYHPRMSVLETGIACGFSGAAVFSRAFKTRFGLSPSAYRQQERKNRKVERNQRKDFPQASRYNDSRTLPERQVVKSSFRRFETMDTEVKTLPTYHVAYIRHISGYSKGEFNSAINQAFQRVCGWAAARDLFAPTTLTIGIPYDNPDITPNDRCRYDACVTVPESVREGGGEVGVQDIPGGKYAVRRISVSTTETHKIGEAVDDLYGDWLPGSGYAIDDKPSLEIYYENPDHAPGEWITMDYCIPIRPL